MAAQYVMARLIDMTKRKKPMATKLTDVFIFNFLSVFGAGWVGPYGI